MNDEAGTKSPPVARCTRCGATSRNIEAVNGACRRQIDRRKRCKGVMRSALNKADWKTCPTCMGTGASAGRRCDQCDGDGWIYVRSMY